jgi:hypothetical protein
VIKVLERAGTTYRMGIDWGLASACFLAFGVVPDAGDGTTSEENVAEARKMSTPFDDYLQIALKKVQGVQPEAVQAARDKLAKGEPLDQEALEAHPLFYDGYFGKDEAWRKIDDEWLAPVGAFGLQLDNKTNNTSLAFALELGPIGEGKVLLFPGDAQVGNWLSWFGPVDVKGASDPVGKTLSWNTGGKAVTTEDLLRRTVLYKVGHHGSHNATLTARDQKPSGLSLMGSEDGTKEFVAMIPIDEFVARNKAGYGDMPLSKIVEELLRRTAGKVMRNDEDAVHTAKETPVLNGKDFEENVPRPLPRFVGKRKTGLFIEYTIRSSD